MRPYRGLTKDGKWVYGDVIYANGVAYIFDGDHGSFVDDDDFAAYNLFEVLPETVGQQTGLKDKNGKDLDWREDDLLRKGPDHSCAPIGKISYNEKCACWELVGKQGSLFCTLETAYKNGWKKIGNIHENLELLK